MRRQSYAVWWSDNGGPRQAGKLELAPLHVLLSGNGNGRIALAVDEINSVAYVRGELRIGTRAGAALRIGSLDAPGALGEVAQALARIGSRGGGT